MGDIVESEAKRAGALYVRERWVGGTVTNYRIIKKNIDKLLTLLKRRETGDLEQYTKKERLLIDREIGKLQKKVGGIVALRGTPAAVFVIDSKREKTSIREACRYNVPIVAVVDSNSDPTNINYVIPGNDDAIKSVSTLVGAVSDAIILGYKDFDKNKADENKIEAVEDAEEAPSLVITATESPKVLEEVIKSTKKEVQEIIKKDVTTRPAKAVKKAK